MENLPIYPEGTLAHQTAGRKHYRVGRKRGRRGEMVRCTRCHRGGTKKRSVVLVRARLHLDTHRSSGGFIRLRAIHRPMGRRMAEDCVVVPSVEEGGGRGINNQLTKMQKLAKN